MSTQETCAERVGRHMRGRLADIRKLWALACDKGPEAFDDELGSLGEYGLCFDYVEPDGGAAFWRWQLSTGGPGDEFRFYLDDRRELSRVEYVFLDWFDGARRKLRDGSKGRALLAELWDSLFSEYAAAYYADTDRGGRGCW